MRRFGLIIMVWIVLLPCMVGAQQASLPKDRPVSPVMSISENTQGFVEATALNLNECYQLALIQSEIIAIDAQLIKEAEAHFLQSFGTLLPQVSFVWTQTNQDSGQAFSSWNKNGGFESKFYFKQTLFSGFKELAGMSGSRLEKNQFIQQKKRAEQLLFVDVADAFYLLLEQREDLKTLESIWNALSDRISELEKREDIGRSRRSEVVSTQTQLYNIEAEIELIKSQELITAELLAFLVGRPVEQISDLEDTPNVLSPEPVYAAKADSRPDVKAAEYAWGMDKKQVVVAKSDLFPTVTLEGNYYNRRNTAPLDQDWSTVLKVDAPIFKGTTTYGAIKEANAQARASELAFARTKRLAARDIHDSFIRAQSTIMQWKAFEKSLKSAEENYSLQRQDYQNSLVNNLDVLAAIQTLGNTKRSYIHSLYEKKRMYWQLEAAIGDVGGERQP